MIYALIVITSSVLFLAVVAFQRINKIAQRTKKDFVIPRDLPKPHGRVISFLMLPIVGLLFVFASQWLEEQLVFGIVRWLHEEGVCTYEEGTRYIRKHNIYRSLKNG